MEIINKEKPKGKAYSINKKMKKAKRLEEEKKFKRLTENKRKNAENRKAKNLEKELIDKVKKVVLKDYIKGMFIVEIEGQLEKRSPNYDKKNINQKNITEEFKNFEIKLYGNNFKISLLENYSNVEKDLIEKIIMEL